MGKIRIKQVRSGIDQPASQKRTLRALGLKKMHQVVEAEGTPQVMGMVHKVKHLVAVEKA